ncbi:phosphonate dehydrogenase [Pelagophyceae sp. CCMP2097]|nr:phosphonate dehydrogenase [Pelagophyceae sp. CCMP2097]
MRRAARSVAVTARCFEETLQHLREAPGVGSVVANASAEPWNRNELIEKARDASALICFMTDFVDAPLLDSLPRLGIVACALKGFDNFDIKECASRGIAVTAVPDLLTAPTAELALALALGLGRRLRECDASMRSGGFRGWRPELYGTGIEGSKIGLLGCGAVGLAVSKRIQGFEPKRILYYDVQAVSGGLGLERVGSVAELVSECDFLFVCSPLNAATRHVIGREALKSAKPNLMLINISRGSCVDECAVADALEEGRIGGYAADVFEFEDWKLPGRPQSVEPRLLTHPNTLLMPHVGSAVESARRGIELAAANEVKRWLAGEALHHRVN